MLEDVGVPDGGEAGRLEVSRVGGQRADGGSEDDVTVLSITEQRSGQPSIIRCVILFCHL